MSRLMRDPATAKTGSESLMRVALPLVAIAIFGTIIVALAGSMWPEVLYRLIVEGSIALLWVLAAFGIGRTILDVARISSSSRALNFATGAGLGLGIMSLLILGLGLFGWLNRPSAIAVLIIGLAASVLSIPKIANRKSQVANPPWPFLLAIPIVAIAVVAVFVLPGLLWGSNDPAGYDVLEYHLQIPREWYEAGKIVPLHHNVFSYFPFNVEMHYLLAMHIRGGPWAGMYLAQLMHLVFVGLTIVAVYGAVRSATGRPQAALLSAIVAACVPWMSMLGTVAYDEGGLLLFGTLAIAWVLQSQRGQKHILLAGAFAGLACGSKLTAVPMVLLAAPLASILSSIANRKSQIANAGAGKVGGFAAFLLAGLLAFSPWLIRNAAWTGNPLFPEAMSIFGKSYFTDVQVERWSRAHSPPPEQRTPSARMQAFGHQIVADSRYAYLLLPAALVAAALARRRSEPRFLILLLVFQAIIWIAFTHLQSRFFVFSVPIAAMLIGYVEWQHWKWAAVAVALVGLSSGMILMVPRIEQLTPAIGALDYGPLLPKAAQAPIEAGRPIALVGDARAFAYQIPMTRLSYRTVFDVSYPFTGSSVVVPWIQGAPSEAAVIVDPAELHRLTSYWKIVEYPDKTLTEPFIFELHPTSGP